MGFGIDDDDERRQERDRKKEEVRKRLEEASRMKKAKKGFLTPERKKRLRKLLMEKAAEDLKRRQAEAEAERQQTIAQRIIPLPPDMDECEDDELRECAAEFIERILELESAIYDLRYVVRQKDYEINELRIAVNDLRGKFVKPTLKKVSKTEGQFAKLRKKDDVKTASNFKVNLKSVDKKQYALD